ncbi:G-box-binding factor 1 [Linum grandiflorum]
MGTGEENTPPKPSKPAASSTPEVPTTPAYPEWPGSMQVYYGTGGTPPFFPSSVASPHPYVYQHPMMPHYGTPVPYPAMYPGGVYAHPNMAMTPNSMAPSMEMEAKAANGKDQPSAKKSKGTSASKAGESRKVASGSGNDAVSQSGESGSDGSSDGSDEQQEYTGSKKGSFNQMLADANAQNNTAAPNHQGTAKMRSGGTSGIVPAAMPEQWGQQDEREVKRQKRKQSNRESARRSRLRKQAECEELQHKVENLNSDNHNLKNELLRLSEECEKLKAENDAIKKKLNESYGQEATDQLEQNDSNRGDEGNS